MRQGAASTQPADISSSLEGQQRGMELDVDVKGAGKWPDCFCLSTVCTHPIGAIPGKGGASDGDTKNGTEIIAASRAALTKRSLSIYSIYLSFV